MDDKVKDIDIGILQDVSLIKDVCKSKIVFALKIKQKNYKIKTFIDICSTV